MADLKPISVRKFRAMWRVPYGASSEERERMRRLVTLQRYRLNPQSFLPPGVKKRWWHMFKSEYPADLLEKA